jgi:Sortase domain
MKSRVAAVAAGIGLIAAGGIVLGVAVAEQHQHAPQPTLAQAGTTSTTSAAQGSIPAPRRPLRPGAAGVHGPVLARSLPVSIAIPAIGVRSAILYVGRNPDGTIQVPPLNDPPITNDAAWYEFSATPGQPGPSIIEGHVDSASDGPSVFFRLGALDPGDLVDVTLADRQVTMFKITGVRLYPKDRFPTSAVYGDTGYAALRLITCGGGFDRRDHRYLSNVVAFASLVSSHPANER